ncbi:MAG: transcription-repair coupling factor [Coraliomargaritaceae bacterium]
MHLKLFPSEIDRNCFIAPCPDIKLLNQGHIQILENDLLEESVQTKKETLHESQVLNLLDFSELVNGDLLVHLQHGLCRYRGITNIELEGNESEVISVEFDKSMLLHVPIREAHLLTRYLGLTKKHPKLAKIGTNQWIKTRTNAEHATLDYASKLLKIYAEREKIKGFAFPKDHPWQSIFEDGFPHKETRDQLSAIKEVKSDMENSKPMDRLICGDVGYGKTEVAIRACFKAVMAGKQVAILVPTTVLCQQHYNHILERMNEFPVAIAMLSGFNSNQKNKKVLEALQSGKIDLIIGTHRLLSKDVTFSNLGLMVIDEEQRFGVKQKEKIKELAKNVDILTLTATPIPRTLHLALSGARSMSVIETPPIDRKPIETIVKSYDLDVICNAITYETLRGGQVFYLHNKVETIESVAQTLRELLPNLKIAVGHGQMEEGILEKVMVQFINGTFDVLVCTTIIESGIDIPNCNTLIIEGADRFGLAQLYQIRGRVGRFNKQAFAYLFLHRHVALVESAHKRLSTLKQYNQLGAGFKIAMRDLELRGAGNLLGAEQSGHITGIGFELYCQLLKESIARLMNAPGSEQIWAEVDLDFLIYGENNSSSKNKKLQPRPLIDTQEENTTIKKACAAIPKSYITEASYRIYFHRAFSMAKDLNKLRSIQSELIDRFGKLPEEVVLLISVHKIRIQASRAGFKSIRTEGDLLKCSYAHTKNKYYKIGSRFPRLTKSITKLRLNEIYNFIKQIKK